MDINAPRNLVQCALKFGLPQLGYIVVSTCSLVFAAVDQDQGTLRRDPARGYETLSALGSACPDVDDWSIVKKCAAMRKGSARKVHSTVGHK